MATATATDAEHFERELLLRGLDMLRDGRNRCVDCGRTPLTGEKVHLYEGRVVCELCRARRREPPLSSELVRHCEHGHTVRLTRAA